jgi:methyl-accepting chemotaxis protein
MKFTIKNKLIAAFGVIILLTSFLGLYSIWSIKSVKDKSSEITEVWVKGSDLAHTMDKTMSEYRLGEYKHVLTDDQDLMDDTEKELQNLRDEFETELNEYQGTIVLQQDKNLFEEIKDDYPKYFETSSKTLQLSRQLKTEEAFNLMNGESRKDFDKVNNTIKQLVEFNQKQANLANIQNNEIYNQSRVMLVINAAIIIVISIVVTISIINNITKRIKFIMKYINNTADLNLVFDQSGLNTISKYKDEFLDMGMALASMRKVLRELVMSIKQNSINVSSNSDVLSNAISETAQSIEAVAKAVDEMAQGSTDLAKNIQDGAEKLEVLAGEIHEVVKSADSMKNYINLVSKSNAEGMHNIKKLREAVEANDEVANKVLTQVEVLDNKSESIEKITDTIKEITSQINLLALNAAIEAARAGEQGRGFAVVAEEIRKLAYEAANSTKEIDIIVREVKSEIKTTKAEMASAEIVVTQMGKASTETEKAFQAINTSVSNIINQLDSLINSINSIDHNKNEVLSSISDMSAIAEESASTTEEISASIQQQSASMEQITQSAKDLKQISVELQNLITKFRT